MSKLINTDSDYNLWISQLVERYRNCQIRATVKANEELLRFYWSIHFTHSLWAKPNMSN